jgi:esterase/lipase
LLEYFLKPEKQAGVIEEEINKIFKNIRSSKEFVVYENSGHQNLYENEPDKWEDTVEAFLEK